MNYDFNTNIVSHDPDAPITILNQAKERIKNEMRSNAIDISAHRDEMMRLTHTNTQLAAEASVIDVALNKLSTAP
jgi:hypothetical protein